MRSMSIRTTARPLGVPGRAVRQSRTSRVLASATPEPAPTRYTTRLEHMDTVLLHPWHDLDLAESELSSYCSTLGPDAATEKCWQAYSFLERKRDQAKAGCDLEQAPGCADLERLNDMTHQLLCTGSMDDLVATFSSLARVEELRAARGATPQQLQQEAAQAAAPGEAGASKQPDAVHALFSRLDTDGDGKLSLVQLRQGMALLGQELDGDTAALIGEAMDWQGGEGIDEQQFRDTLDAERLNSHSQVATMWRRHHPCRPAWWSDAPAGKGSMLS